MTTGHQLFGELSRVGRAGLTISCGTLSTLTSQTRTRRTSRGGRGRTPPTNMSSGVTMLLAQSSPCDRTCNHQHACRTQPRPSKYTRRRCTQPCATWDWTALSRTMLARTTTMPSGSHTMLTTSTSWGTTPPLPTHPRPPHPHTRPHTQVRSK